MTGYTKTKTFLTNTTILAGDFNTEFNNLTVAFDATNGHSHNGDASLGAYVPLISSTDGFTKITTTEATDQLNFYTKVSGAAALQLSFKDGVIEPNADSDVDIGTTAKRFKDLYVDSATVTGTVTAGGLTLGAGEIATFNSGAGGDLQISGDATGSFSLIKQTGGGDLIIQGENGSLRNDADDSLLAWDADNVNLSWQGATGAGTKLSTTETGIDVTGEVKGDTLTIDNGSGDTNGYIASATGATRFTVKSTHDGEEAEEVAGIEVGAKSLSYLDLKTPDTDDYDLRIYHSEPANHSMIDSLAEDLFLRSGGKVALQHAGANTKLATTSTGIDVTGTIECDTSLQIQSSGSSVDAMPDLYMTNIETAADAQNLGMISFRGYNDASTPTIEGYANIYAQQVDVSDGAEKGKLVFQARNGADYVEALEVNKDGIDVTGTVTVSGTVDGRDIATDGTKLDAIEAGADVTDTANVVAALTAGTNITIAGNGTITATDTDTTYSVQDGELSENNFTNDDHTKLNNIEASADITDTTNVVAALTAGTNIAIAANGTITATDTNTEYTGGTGLTLSAGNEFSVDAAQTSITSVGALSGGSIASGFGAIDNGASAITTTGTVTTGSLVLNSSTALTSIDTDISTVSTAHDTLPTALATKTYVDAVTAAASAGDITSVVAGDGLTGGATSGDATVTVVGGVGIVANADEVVLDLNELTTSTADADGDFFAVVDTGGAQKKLTKANIALSGMNNDSGWTANAGTVTSVGAGTGLATTGGTTPSLSVNAAQSGITSLGTLSALNVTGDLTLEALYPTGLGNLFLGTISGGSAVDAAAQYNTGVGNAALGAVTTATFNTAVGAAALQSLTTGTNNVAFGLNSSKSMVSAASNSSFGVSALYSLVNGSSNTALGTYAGYSLTTASSNVLVGTSAGYDLTTGGSNTVLGSNAARKATTVTNSVVIGNDAGYNLGSQGGIIAIGHDAMKGSAVAGAFTGGEACIAIGENALESLSIAEYCTAIGDQAGKNITTGSHNTLYGAQSGDNLTVGAFNTLCGVASGDTLTTGTGNTAMGYLAAGTTLNSVGLATSIGYGAGMFTGTGSVSVGYTSGFNQDGQNNTFIGRQAAYGTSTYRNSGETPATENTGIGYKSLYSLAGGASNTAIGRMSGATLTTGGYNTLLGRNAGYDLSTGSDNVFIGSSAGQNMTTGSGNIVIGVGSGSGLNSANNVTIIGSATGSQPNLNSAAYAGTVVISSNDPSYPDPILLLEKTGNVSIPANNGVWHSQYGGFKFENASDTKILKWARGSTSNSNAYAYLFYGSTGSIIGSINSTSTSISISYTSDYRLKENVSPLTGSIDRLKALKPCTFNFLSEPTRQEEGFIAHEVQEVVPQAVVGVKDAVDENGDAELQGVDPSRIVVILTGALQEAIEKIEQLEERISALEA